MSSGRGRFPFLLPLCVAVALICSPPAFVMAHGGGGGGGGGHGGGGGGGGGGFGGGGGWGGGYAGGGHSSGSYGGWSGGHAYSGQSHGNFSQSSFHGSSTGANHGHSGDWNHGHAGDWNHGQWNHNWAWWNHYGPGWYGGWGFGFDFWWPWFGLAWWPGYYDYCYGVPYAGYYCDTYTYGAAPYVALKPADDGSDSSAAPSGAGTSQPPSASAGDTFDFYDRGLAAFGQGEYRDAARLAAHAAVDEPRNAKVHLLLSLGLFATGEYRGAAIEAHAVASLGRVPDWATLYGLYGSVDAYTTHLRALEKSVHDNPSSPEGRFLLGFQYMMAGHRDEARDEFLKALKLAPRDRVAGQLLIDEGGTVPPDIAKQLSELPPSQSTLAPGLPKPPMPQAPPSK